MVMNLFMYVVVVIQKFPELRFRYVEEDQPEEFFVPYVWSLIYHHSRLYFNSSRVQLLNILPSPSPTSQGEQPDWEKETRLNNYVGPTEPAATNT